MLGRRIVLLAVAAALLLPWNAAAQRPHEAPARARESLSGSSGGIWRTYSNGNYVNDLAVEGDTVWAATGGGVVRWDRTAGTYVKYTTVDGLASNDVRAVGVDAAGHKWFGTNGGGVSVFDGTTWTTYTTADGLTDNDVQAIAVDGTGHIWFGTWGGGVSEFDGTTWTTYTTADGLASNYVYAIAVDGANHKWFGTSGGVNEFFHGYAVYLPLILTPHR